MYQCNAETLGAEVAAGATYPVYYVADAGVPGGYKLVVGNNSGYIPCTSTTRPSHSEGTQIAETDTGKLYTSTAGVWVKTGHFTAAGRSKYRTLTSPVTVNWNGSGSNTGQVTPALLGQTLVEATVVGLIAVQHTGLWSLWFRYNLGGSSNAINAVGSYATISLSTPANVLIANYFLPFVNNADFASGSIVVPVDAGTRISYSFTNGDTTFGNSLSVSDGTLGGDWISN